MNKLTKIGLGTAAALLVGIGTAFAATTVVSPVNMNGWDQANYDDSVGEVGAATTASGSKGLFVTGPGTPPSGVGSYQEEIGTDGDDAVRIRTAALNGALLSSITEMSYSTYVQNAADSQAPYIRILIDRDGNGTTDDSLFFEPVYQNGTYTMLYSQAAIANQCGGNPACVTLDTWQTWDADAGAWWSANDSAGGPPLTTLAAYAAQYPGAKIATDAPAVRIQSGGGAPTWNNFVGNIDAFTVNGTTYDFEPTPTHTVTIHKYVEGAHATNSSADSLSFPMQSTWNATNIGAGSGSFALAPSTYDAETSEMTEGASYSTNEDTSGPNVGASCADGKPFALMGYSTGDSESAAAAAPISSSSPALTNITSDKHVIVWNEDCTPPFVNVTIIKYVDETHATAGNANSSVFPFTATYNASNIGTGSDPFDIGPVGNNTPNAYEARTIDLAAGADYKAEENTTGNNVVGATCADGKPFALSGYSSGDSLAAAQSAATSSQAPAFTNLTSDKYVIVHNVTCEPEDVTVTIVKYVDGAHATAGNANNASFPMQSSWDDANNGGVGNSVYTLSPAGFNTAAAYEAVTTDMANGSDYATNEDLSTSVVGANCANNQQFRLTGYSTGNSLAEAQSNATTSQSPAFTDITSDKFVIVWNAACPPPASLVPPANACATPTVAPAGYTLQNGTTGNDTATIAPNTMFVGKGGSDKVTGGPGNYIVCTGSGNDIITLGDGNSTIDAGGGSNTITVGNGEGTILSGSGNDIIMAGNGARTINAAGGSNKITTGDQVQTITTTSGNDEIKAGGGDDTVDAGGGSNKLWGEGGNDSLTATSGNDKLDGGAGTDTCNAGGGTNTKTGCELP